jgi:hypothetical protein
MNDESDQEERRCPGASTAYLRAAPHDEAMPGLKTLGPPSNNLIVQRTFVVSGSTQLS